MKNYNFAEWLYEQEIGPNKGNILGPALNAQDAVNFLIYYLLGDTWYVSYAATSEQVNAEAVDNILLKYSRKYRNDLKKLRKEVRKVERKCKEK